MAEDRRGLTSNAWRGALRSSLRALPALLLVAAILTGCSGFASPTEEVPTVGPEPSYRTLIATKLRSSFKNYASYNSFEIGEPRWVHTVQGHIWLSCVRFQDRDRLRTYAVFFKANAVTDSRFAVQTDECETQAYAPFDGMNGIGLDPLH
jgi:hypothetical protein